MCNYVVECAHAFFMCLAKTEAFNYVYELSKERSTESTEVENKVLYPQNKDDESGACPGFPGPPCCPVMSRELLHTCSSGLQPSLPHKGPFSWYPLQLNLHTENRNQTS